MESGEKSRRCEGVISRGDGRREGNHEGAARGGGRKDVSGTDVRKGRGEAGADMRRCE